MTLANGSPVITGDIDFLVTVSLALLQNDNRAFPGMCEEHFYLQDVVAGTTPTLRTIVFVTPVDLIVETVAVETGDHTAASTTTVAITGDGAVTYWPVTETGTTGAGITKLARRLFDNTKTATGDAFATTSKAFRTFTKGSTITMVVTTTSVATPSLIHVVLCWREFYARE